jgi:hypothetical protein
MRPRGTGRLSIAYGRLRVNIDSARRPADRGGPQRGALGTLPGGCGRIDTGATATAPQLLQCSGGVPHAAGDFVQKPALLRSKAPAQHAPSLFPCGTAVALSPLASAWANAGAGHCRPCSPRSTARDASDAAPRRHWLAACRLRPSVRTPNFAPSNARSATTPRSSGISARRSASSAHKSGRKAVCLSQQPGLFLPATKIAKHPDSA